MSLNDLIRISHKYGQDPDFVLAGGGNTSYKDSEFLYIKGSGTTLATITAEGFVKMNRAKLNAMFNKTYSEDATEREAQVLEDMMDAREKTELHKRPSVETLLHNLFQYKFVVHTHPAMLNGLTCGKDGRKIADELFGDRIIWIDLVEPGYVLATCLNKAMKEYTEKTNKDADIIILQNHGVFIAGDSEEEIDEKTKFIFDALKDRIKEYPDLTEANFDKEKAALIAPAIRMLLRDGGTSFVTFRTNNEILKFMENEESFYPVSSTYVTIPLGYIYSKC
jgi:rhamnose utilization protein RhaD (predicted bifunctional aldolase and dehydrogenase)